MPCGRRTMKWKRAMQTARRQYPHASLTRRRRIAAAIARGRKK